MSGGSRSLPARPSLRHLKLEAKRRRAASEFATLHDAQAAIAREHGLPSWARLKQVCAAQNGAAEDGAALAHLRWIVERFSGADRPGWTPPGEDEFREHSDDRLLAAIPAGGLAEAIAGMAADLLTELVVVGQAPLEVQVQLAGRPFLAPREATSCAEMILRACARAGFVPRVVARATDFAVLLSLVAAGAGVTLVPGLAARQVPPRVRLVPPAEPVTRRVFTVSRRGGDRKPAVRVVLDALSAAGSYVVDTPSKEPTP